MDTDLLELRAKAVSILEVRNNLEASGIELTKFEQLGANLAMEVLLKLQPKPSRIQRLLDFLRS